MSERKALVVDDEFHIIQVVAIKLRNNGFEVITAENGRQGLELALSEKPDIIITDYQMPIMTGLEFIENLRGKPEGQDVPVIMLTARDFSIEEETKSHLKISACLSKPFSQRELLENINEVLAQGAVK